jgi:hypothetical protein
MLGGIMRQRGFFARATAICCGLVIASGCTSGAAKSDSSATVAQAATPSKERTGADRNACDLLTLAEVAALAGAPVTAKEMSSANGPPEPATESNRVHGRSDCHWVGADGMPRLIVVGYWTGGKQGWQILTASRSMARGMIQKQEGVALDSVVQSGPVAGLGDKAFFSPLLESLVLKDDILLEITTSLLPKPEAQFRPLVTKMLSRL